MNDFYFNQDAIELLSKAVHIRTPYFMCFGKYYSYLLQFEFIDDEMNVTHYGRQFVGHCMRSGRLYSE